MWVFGGQNVYKNFFDRAKYCEAYALNEIAKHFGLTREKLIMLAMLTGSDYTDGVENVGPVTAMEILAEFPAGKGIVPLENFAQWWKEMTGSKGQSSAVPVTKVREHFRTLDLPPSFPNAAVAEAYTNPALDTSTEKFTWAVPNFVAVRDYATEKFGWSKVKTDQVIKPVIRKMTSKIQFQSRIDNYFQMERPTLSGKGHLQSSKRVQHAIQRVLNKDSSEVTKNEIGKGKKKQNKKEQRKEKSTKDAKKVDSTLRKITEANMYNCSEPSSERVKVSCTPSKELEEKKNEAKQKAIEIYRRSKSTKTRVISEVNSKSASKVRSSKKGPKRTVLATHHLSESDESD